MKVSNLSISLFSEASKSGNLFMCEPFARLYHDFIYKCIIFLILEKREKKNFCAKAIMQQEEGACMVVGVESEMMMIDSDSLLVVYSCF